MEFARLPGPQLSAHYRLALEPPVLQPNKASRNKSQRIHDRGYLPGTARQEKQGGVRYKAPENTLRHGERQPDETYGDNSQQHIVEFFEYEDVYAPKHIRPDHKQHDSGCIGRHSAHQSSDKQTGNEDQGAAYGGQAGATSHF